MTSFLMALAGTISSTPSPIADGLRNIKYAWQRVTRGWDDTAAFSIDYHLAKLIPELVNRLKTSGVTPISAFDGMEADASGNYNPEQIAIARARWKKTLEEIVEGFEQYSTSFDFGCACPYGNLEKFEKGFALFKEHFGELWS